MVKISILSYFVIRGALLYIKMRQVKLTKIKSVSYSFEVVTEELFDRIFPMSIHRYLFIKRDVTVRFSTLP